MNNNWKEVKALLDELFPLDQKKREAMLVSSDISDEVRSEVRSLLAVEDEASKLMNASAIELSTSFFTESETHTAFIGKKIGIYKIVREIDDGGMGAVYLATRNDGRFEQRVAIKLLRRELNTAGLRRRFEQERRILASLEHKNIARLLDAGTTDDGVPYFVMEYVEGAAIDQYCDQNELDLNARLDLFREVCEAVNFAHRNLIVHRDIKPSNILVTADGMPKLLDFGISKIISDELEKTATVTRLGAMTPSYASPEQLQNKSVTTATDIYSLGVVLYKLLSGHRPFEARESDLNAIYQAVVETDPPAPSSMIDESSQLGEPRSAVEHESATGDTASNRSGRTISNRSHVQSNQLKGDLDNIILKALKKEPERRYSSAENFAEDIHRYQRGLTVSARPDVFSYRAAKFVRRNRLAAAAAALLLVAVLAGVIATLWQYRVAAAERLRAEKRFADVRKLANSYLFDVYPEIENLEGSLKAREKIVTNALEYLDSLSNEATGDLELQSELATAYEKIGDVLGAMTNASLGNIQAGLDSYRKAQSLREAVHSANPSDIEATEKLANNYYTSARTLWNNSQTGAAEEMFEKGLKLRRELVAEQPEKIEYQNRLAVLLIDYAAIPAFNKQTEKTLRLLDEARAIVGALRQLDPGNSDFKKTLARLLRLMSKPKSAAGDYDGALQGLNEALVASRELTAQTPNDFRIARSVWLTETLICEVYIDKADGKNGAEACLPTIAFPTTALAKESENGVVAYDLAISHFNTARAFRFAGQFQKTIEHAERALEIMSRLSAKTPDNLEYKRNLAVYETEMARALMKLNQFDMAAAVLQSTIEKLVIIAAADKETTMNSFDLSMAYRLSAQTFYQTGNKAKAGEIIEKAIGLATQLNSAGTLPKSEENLLSELKSEKAKYQK